MRLRIHVNDDQFEQTPEAAANLRLPAAVLESERLITLPQRGAAFNLRQVERPPAFPPLRHYGYHSGMGDQESTWIAGLAKRFCWHSFGALATAVFMVGAMSATKGNSRIADVPDGVWLLISAAGFAGILRYSRWYRS
ncbi:MAG: hypothetical protein HY290_33370 [Planctomycetia bacterium]|nr:hypothetical protein [Planctomycetia bacterium]